MAISITMTAATSGTAGLYHADEDLYDLAGRENIRLASNLDNANVGEDAQRVRRAIEWSESTVHLRLRSIYAVPMVLTGDDLLLVRDVCARLSLWWLHQNRGLQDEDSDIAGKLQNHKRIADDRLGRWASGIDTLNTPRKHRGPVGIEAM